MKVCGKCGENKDPNEFYRHPRMADGHLRFCKVCVRARVANHRAKNLASVRAYDRERAKRPRRLAFNAENARRWRKENPEKYRAHTVLNNAVRDGKVRKSPCEVCGSEKAHGHHHDYSKPFDVRWLCAAHHQEQHH